MILSCEDFYLSIKYKHKVEDKGFQQKNKILAPIIFEKNYRYIHKNNLLL